MNVNDEMVALELGAVVERIVNRESHEETTSLVADRVYMDLVDEQTLCMLVRDGHRLPVRGEHWPMVGLDMIPRENDYLQVETVWLGRRFRVCLNRLHVGPPSDRDMFVVSDAVELPLDAEHPLKADYEAWRAEWNEAMAKFEQSQPQISYRLLHPDEVSHYTHQEWVDENIAQPPERPHVHRRVQVFYPDGCPVHILETTTV